MREQSMITAPAERGLLRAARGLLRWFDRTPRLLLFGFVVSVLGTFELSRVHPAPWTLMGTRLDSLEWTLTALENGGPILTAQPPGSSDLYASGGGDDQGLFLLIPWLANVLGWEDPVNLLRWTALIALGVAIALFPWMVRAISGSTLAALMSPFALLIGLWLMPLSDIYWVATWVALLLIPLVLILDRRWPRRGLPLLLGLLVLASAASAIRSQAGLAVLICAALVVFRRPWSGWMKSGAVVLCVVAYLSVGTFGIAAAREVRESQLGDRTLASQTGSSHPLWHSAYIGYGYLPNDWDIHYFDDIGYRDVLREDPKAKFNGPAYHRILRERYLSLLVDHPVHTAKVYGAKLVVALRPAVPALLALAILSPWLLLVDPRRRRWRRDALFLTVAALVGLAAPMVATPFSAYLLGWLPVVLLAAILAGGAALSAWPSPLTYARSLGRSDGSPGRRKAVLGTAAAGLVVLAVVVVIAPGIEREALDWNSTPPPRVTQPADAVN
ncbi:MAG TPA: hypothetical protein VNO82_14830 [Solirubrobacteraceae bacterium]|nr:hypothetical protein [Solirubrobacteraceae bacterium]